MGLIYGGYGGRSDEFAPGGFSFENGFCPHGGEICFSGVSHTMLSIYLSVSYDEFKKATEAELGPMRVHEGTLGKYRDALLYADQCHSCAAM